MNNQTRKAGKNPRQLRRSTRYGKLVPAWRWRTTPTRLGRMEDLREKLGISKTEFIEMAVDNFVAVPEKFAIAPLSPRTDSQSLEITGAVSAPIDPASSQ